MKILVHSLDRHAGGVEISVSKFDLLLNTIPKNIVIYKDIINLPHISKVIRIKPIKIPKFILKFKRKIPILSILFGFFIFFYRVINTKKILNKNEIVIAFDDYFAGIALFCSNKVIVSVHNSPKNLYKKSLVHLLPDWWYKIFLYKFLYKKACKIHVVSEGIKRELVENFRIENSKIEVIYNFFDKEEIQKKSKEFEIEFKNYIINVGNLNRAKNQKMLIDIYGELNIKEDLVIIGDGERKEEFKNLIKIRNLESKVFLLGRRNNPFPYMKNAKLFVLTSKYEGFPSVLVEAAILEIPICAIKCPHGVEEIVLNTCRNKQELKKDILKTLNNKNYRKTKILYQNKILKKKFNLNNNVKKWENIINYCQGVK